MRKVAFPLPYAPVLLAIYIALAMTGGSRAKILSAAAHPTYFVALSGNDSDPGTADRPWATIDHAARAAVAGDTVFVRGGRYLLRAQIRPANSGRANLWITFSGYPGEDPVLDAQSIQLPALDGGALDNGAFQIEGVSHIRVANISVVNSHNAGITVRDSSDVELINNRIDGTFSSGIAVSGFEPR